MAHHLHPRDGNLIKTNITIIVITTIIVTIIMKDIIIFLINNQLYYMAD